mmetsp:Transcript_33859/g.80993  ORF Transcript_33859/g.80993 Transcript_33859/m.80993 type:complete len:204 (-) Transcript_33859:231-842(-)
MDSESSRLKSKPSKADDGVIRSSVPIARRGSKEISLPGADDSPSSSRNTPSRVSSLLFPLGGAAVCRLISSFVSLFDFIALRLRYSWPFGGCASSHSPVLSHYLKKRGKYAEIIVFPYPYNRSTAFRFQVFANNLFGPCPADFLEISAVRVKPRHSLTRTDQDVSLSCAARVLLFTRTPRPRDTAASSHQPLALAASFCTASR